MEESDYIMMETTVEHINALRGRLRESDKREILAASGYDPDAALMNSFRLSHFCWTAFHRGKVIAIFGVNGISIMSAIGSPWMLGSDELNRAGIEIVKVSRYYVGEMKKHFPQLINYIDARQLRSIRWLKWLGFKIEKPEPYGVSKLPFHKFWM